ncbi:MAG: tRNA preQ1(34) S-adenosylmethionine ribosyltransferase-isomerase QueA [Planctomycetota bacterium]
MKVCELDYDLPSERIAQTPCEPRDAARLMVLHRATGVLEHRVFRELPGLLTERDCLVVNRTRVLPAKFVASRRTGGRIEGLFVHEVSPGLWTVLLSGAGRVREGERLALGDSPWSLILRRRGERGLCEVALSPPDPAAEVLERIGATPLPPYIRRRGDELADVGQLDRRCYQTVYADEPGAVAAPTAGMHFTEAMLENIRAAGTSIADVVLHVGLGTFQPVEVEDLADHAMHSEWYRLSPRSARTILDSREAGGRTVAVGTTTVRVLETCGGSGTLEPQSGWTNILIHPPHTFSAVDVLLTNFHLPRSTLLALVCAFAGREAIMEAYRCAVAEGYRFYSYGDAMLIL